MTETGTNLVITGLPRSGTSLLCARVNAFSNTAIINEPAELFQVAKGANVEGVTSTFAQYRHDITQGRAVLNKIKDGKFIEDTRIEDSRSPHVHPIDDPKFTLGIKNTLLFLAMLDDIARLQQIKVVASIRHPLDCIASWRSVSFPHLKNAKPDFLMDYATDAFKGDLQNVVAESDIDIRAAKLWCLLAKTIVRSKEKLLLLRYEDMVKRPEQTVGKLSNYLGVGIPQETFEVSSPVRRRVDLSPQQLKKISEVCAKLASQFGYRMK